MFIVRMRQKFIVVLFSVLCAVQFMAAQDSCESEFCRKLLLQRPRFEKLCQKKSKGRMYLLSSDYTQIDIMDSRLLVIPSIHFRNVSRRIMEKADNFLCLLDTKSFLKDPFEIQDVFLLTDTSLYNVGYTKSVRLPASSSYTIKRGRYGVLHKVDFYKALITTLDSIQPDFCFLVCGDFSYVLYLKDGKVGVLKEWDGCSHWIPIGLEEYVETKGTPGNAPYSWKDIKTLKIK